MPPRGKKVPSNLFGGAKAQGDAVTAMLEMTGVAKDVNAIQEQLRQMDAYRQAVEEIAPDSIALTELSNLVSSDSSVNFGSYDKEARQEILSGFAGALANALGGDTDKLLRVNMRVAQIMEDTNKKVDSIKTEFETQEQTEKRREAERKEELQKVLDKIGSVGDAFSNGVDAFTNISSTVRAGSISGDIHLASSLVGAVAPEAGAVIEVVGQIWDGIQKVGDEITKWNKQGTHQLNQTGTYNIWTDTAMKMEADFLSTFDPRADKADYTTIQNTLTAARADYGTLEYDRGLEYSLDLMQKYGLSAAQASQWYTKVVVDGGGSVEDLTKTLDVLQQKVKDGVVTMDQAIQSLTTWSQTLHSSLGRSDSSAAAMAASMGALLEESEVGTGAMSVAMKAIGKWGDDPGFNMAVDRYMQQNGGDMAAAYVAAAYDYSAYDPSIMYGSYDSAYYTLNAKSYSGQSLMDMLYSGDYEGVTEAAGGSAEVMRSLWSMANALGIGGNMGDEDMIKSLAGAWSGTDTLGNDVGSQTFISADRRRASITGNNFVLDINIDGPIAVSDLYRATTQRNLDEGNG